MNGKKINLEYQRIKEKLINKCKLFCPLSVIGCGLSHIYLNEIISKSCQKNTYSLILEDDVEPFFQT